MSQTFHVLKCVQCKQFQNHIVKRASNKWNCKLCNTKQTLLQVYGEGTGAECRYIVQKLNLARGEYEELKILTQSQEYSNFEVEFDEEDQNHQKHDTSIQESSETKNFGTTSSQDLRPTVVPREQSKWSKYAVTPEENY